MAIWQKPLQLKENLRWRMVETSDEDSTVFNELCPCTLGHSYEFEAKLCAQKHEILNNPVKLAEATKTKNCYGCKFYGHTQQPTKHTVYLKELKGVFRGTVFKEWCEHPKLQTEESDYNEEYVSRDHAESVCADYEYQYFEPKTGA
jgi:hypothetical protein